MLLKRPYFMENPEWYYYDKKKNIILSIIVFVLVCVSALGLVFFLSNNTRKNTVNRAYLSMLKEALQYEISEKNLKEILTNGANKARVYASKKMEVVKEKVGLEI